ncbi:MAG: O-antigen ligase family protein [Minisyncoccia bacterium]
MNKFLKGLIYFGIFLVPLIPFLIFSGTFFPFITGKGFAFRFLIEIIFVAWLILALRDYKSRGKWTWLSVVIGVFVLIVGLADSFGENSFKSIWSNYERMEGFVTIAHVWMYFTVMASILKTEGIWVGLFNTWLGMSVLMSGYGLIQISRATDLGYRVDGTLGNATYLAVYILINIFLAIFLLYRHLDKAGGLKKFFISPATYIYLPIIVLEFYILYKTGTRGTMLGFIGGFFLASLLIALFEKKDLLLKRIALGGILGIIILVGAFIFIRQTNFVQSNHTLQRYASISWSDTKTQARSMIWPMAWQGFTERPILGWGQENFNYVFNKNYDPRMYNHEQWFDRTHNVVLDWLIASGSLGCLAYLAIYVVALWLIWRRRAGGLVVAWRDIKHSLMFWKKDEVELTEERGFTITERAILTGLFSAYFVHNMFVFDNLVSYLLFFMVLAYIHSQEVSETVPWLEKSLDKVKIDVPTVDRLVAPLLIVVLLFAFYFVNIKPLNQNTSLIQSLMLNQMGKPEEALAGFKKALSYNTFGDYETREQLSSFASNVGNMKVPDEVKMKIVNFAYEEMQKQISLTPKDTRYQVFMASMLDRLNMSAEAQKYWLQAKESSPNKQSIRLPLTQNYLAQKQNAEALIQAEETFNLETSYREARLSYGLVLIYNGKVTEGEEIITSLNEPSIWNDTRILLAYINGKNPDKAVAIINKEITANPKDTNAHLKLAQVYNMIGKKYEAIVEIKKIITLDPTFKAKGEEFIKEITATLE